MVLENWRKMAVRQAGEGGKPFLFENLLRFLFADLEIELATFLVYFLGFYHFLNYKRNSQI